MQARGEAWRRPPKKSALVRGKPTAGVLDSEIADLMALIYRWRRIDPTTLSRVDLLMKHTVGGLVPGLFQLFQAVSKRCETGNYLILRLKSTAVSLFHSFGETSGVI